MSFECVQRNEASKKPFSRESGPRARFLCVSLHSQPPRVVKYPEFLRILCDLTTSQPSRARGAQITQTTGDKTPGKAGGREYK